MSQHMKSDFPNYQRTAKLGELGVSIVSRVLSDSFGWLFKRNHQEHDFGIDGQGEIVTDAGAVTGQMFAVQIKCGQSFFNEKNQWGYVYRGESKHFNYLANYPIPVFICICDPHSGSCYWAQFKTEAAEPTEAGWKFTIPFGSVLAESKERILAILRPVHDAAAELESYWALNRLLLGSSVIQYAVDSIDVSTFEVGHVRAFFDRLRSTQEMALSCQGKVELVIFGYDDDPRELWEIEEVRAYVSVLDRALPELLFFSRTEKPTFTLQLFVMCQTEVEWIDGRSTREVIKQVSIDTRAIGDFLSRHWEGLNELTDWLGMPELENKRISFAAARCLGIFPPGGEDV
jgi:hypothetical protein